MAKQMVTVAVFGSSFEAGIARIELESRGIPVFLANEFSMGLDTVKVTVPASNFEEARQILTIEVPIEDSEHSASKDTINTHEIYCLKDIRHLRNEVWRWCLLCFVAGTVFLTIFRLTVGEPSNWSFTALNFTVMVVYFILGRRLSKMVCPGCGYSELRLHPMMRMKIVKCRICGYQFK